MRSISKYFPFGGGGGNITFSRGNGFRTSIVYRPLFTVIFPHLFKLHELYLTQHFFFNSEIWIDIIINI
jgi:hypothetical protein